MLIGTFGIMVERRLGALAALGLFWGTSAAGALGGGLLLHVLYPLFPEVHAFTEGGWYRVFNGASAGAFGFMGAYATMARWPLLWVGLFCVWEPGFWLLVSGDFRSASTSSPSSPASSRCDISARACAGRSRWLTGVRAGLAPAQRSG